MNKPPRSIEAGRDIAEFIEHSSGVFNVASADHRMTRILLSWRATIGTMGYRYGVLISLLALAVLVLAAGAACGGGDDSALVVLRPEGRPEVRVRVELARTGQEQARGLMFREHLDADAGMLFLYEGEAIRTFWMRNTLIPLDMIFISADRRVVGVVANAEPQTDTLRQVDQPSQYVLEVNGGFAAAHGIAAGTPVEFRNID